MSRPRHRGFGQRSVHQQYYTRATFKACYLHSIPPAHRVQSLALDFAYSGEQARGVAVDSPGIVEALRKVYDAGDLADELVSGKAK